MNNFSRYFSRYLSSIDKGTVEWIGLRPARREPMQVVTRVEAISERGLKGDRHCDSGSGSNRQVTLMNIEHINLVEKFLSLPKIDPLQLRRNILVSGVNLNALRYQTIQVGAATLEIMAHCHPCRRMNENLNHDAAVAALYGYAGWCCRVVEGGIINVGDSISLLPSSS